MLVHNMLEKVGTKYKVGNIKLIKVKELVVEVYKRNGEIIKYRKV